MTDVILRPDFKAKPRPVLTGTQKAFHNAMADIVANYQALDLVGALAVDPTSDATARASREQHARLAAREIRDAASVIIALLGGNEPESAA